MLYLNSSTTATSQNVSKINHSQDIVEAIYAANNPNGYNIYGNLGHYNTIRYSYFPSLIPSERNIEVILTMGGMTYVLVVHGNLKEINLVSIDYRILLMELVIEIATVTGTQLYILCKKSRNGKEKEGRR
ncbi:MAG: hypothetical protein QXU98_06220 [Candidatus Parvarchaeota archaeon]